MKRVILAGICALLAACTAPAPRQEQATPASAVPADIPVADRAAVSNFIAVSERLEPVAEAECRARAPRSNCDFRIVVDDRPNLPPNAYQTLDRGRPIIAFTASLIGETRNQDEIAFIMAHEAAHHIEGHLALQQQNATLGAALATGLAGALARGDASALEAAQQFGAAVGARTYSKDYELEADELGTIIAARAGFNPLRGAEFFFRIPDPGDRFLGTHPPNAQRVAVVRQTAAQLGFR